METEAAIDTKALANRIADVRARIAEACARVGRPSSSVTLIGVSKTVPLAFVEAARKAGLVDFGENRAQELEQKAAQLPGRITGGSVCWHMIGHLQRNKARKVIEYADLFHGLDSVRLARTLDDLAAQAGRVLPCLVQVNMSGEASKSGCAPLDTHGLVSSLSSFRNLRIEGLMTIAEASPDPHTVRTQFRQLQTLLQSYNAIHKPEVPLQTLSMGMSGDFEIAVEEGATHVRVGSAIFGPRVYERG